MTNHSDTVRKLKFYEKVQFNIKKLFNHLYKSTIEYYQTIQSDYLMEVKRSIINKYIYTIKLMEHKYITNPISSTIDTEKPLDYNNILHRVANLLEKLSLLFLISFLLNESVHTTICVFNMFYYKNDGKIIFTCPSIKNLIKYTEVFYFLATTILFFTLIQYNKYITKPSQSSQNIIRTLDKKMLHVLPYVNKLIASTNIENIKTYRLSKVKLSFCNICNIFHINRYAHCMYLNTCVHLYNFNDYLLFTHHLGLYLISKYMLLRKAVYTQSDINSSIYKNTFYGDLLYLMNYVNMNCYLLIVGIGLTGYNMLVNYKYRYNYLYSSKIDYLIFSSVLLLILVNSTY